MQCCGAAVGITRAIGAELVEMLRRDIGVGRERRYQTLGAQHLAVAAAEPEHDRIVVLAGGLVLDLRKISGGEGGVLTTYRFESGQAGG